MADLVIRDRLEATEPEAASDALRSVVGEGRIEAAAGPFHYLQASLVDDGISVSRVTASGTDVRAVMEGSPDLIAVLVRSGSVRLSRGSEVADLAVNDIGLIPMGESVALRWADCGLDLFSFPLSSIARLLGTGGRAVRLRAPSILPQSPQLATYWRRLASGQTLQMLSEPDLYQRDLLRAQMVDALVAATIETFGLSDRSEEDPQGDPEPLRRALEFMRAHLGDPISISDVAAAAGMSARGLQLLFGRSLDTTPVAHLRRLRLTGAHESLRTTAPGATVGAVARRFGYSNLGRFSAHYRDQFGEMPSRTLQAALEH